MNVEPNNIHNMRTITQNIYTFEDLSDKVQAKVLSDNLYILTEHNWWSDTYNDANETAGLDISGFDIDQNYIEAHFTISAKDSALRVISEHGEQCDTYSIAKKFLSNLDELGRATAQTEAELEELEDLYLRDIKRAYLTILNSEFNYLCSDEVITDHITENEWEFYEDGSRYKS